jgi:hypothetical protein
LIKSGILPELQDKIQYFTIPKKTMNQLLDPAALLRAGQKSGQPLPDALGVGKSVTLPQYGTGKVTGWLGNRLIVKFPGYSVPLQFPNWQESIASGELVLAEIIPSESSPSTPAILAAIQSLKKPEFRAIATELAERLTYITVIHRHRSNNSGALL